MARAADDRPRGNRGAPTALTLRDSGPHEAELLLRIQRAACVAAFLHVFPPERYPFPDAEVLERWREFGGRVIVAEREGTAVGLAAVEGAWLCGLYAVPEEWGSGVGDRLHREAVEAIAAAHDRAHLWTLVENHRGRAFYERRGWQLNGESRVVPFPPNPLDVGYTLELPRSA